MLSGELESAWVDSRKRFGTLEAFINTSDELAPKSNVEFRGALYSSWVLLTYAAMEAGINSLGSACLRIIGRVAPTPADLPADLLGEHRLRSINYLAGLANAKRQNADFAATLSSLDTIGWHERSRLMTIDGNVWPDSVREWMGRIGVDSPELKWLTDPSERDSETLESRIRQLISERNQLAHGGRPDNLLRASLMCEWLGDARLFVRRSGQVMQRQLANLLDLPLNLLGEVDTAVSLGNSTVGIAKLWGAVAVGDHLLLREVGVGIKSCNVVSLQRNHQDLSAAAPGSTQVAVTVDRRVRGGELFLAI